MTCIVEFPGQQNRGGNTKKRLRELLTLSGWENMAYRVHIQDPSIIQPRDFDASDMKVGQREVVTNHPKRSWFAEIIRTESGFKVL